MISVFKYSFALTDALDKDENSNVYATFPMHQGGKVVSVKNQFDRVCLYAEVDTEAAMEHRKFYIVGTGQAIGNKMGAYLGTAIFRDGELVIHVYEAKA